MNTKPFRFDFVRLLDVMGKVCPVVLILSFMYLAGRGIVEVYSFSASDPMTLNARVLHIQSPDVVVVDSEEGVLHVLLDDIQTPRLSGDCMSERNKARAAMAWLRVTLTTPSPDHSPLIIEAAKSFKGLRLTGGYLVATPKLADGRDLVDEMIAVGHAVRAQSDGRKIWWGC